jgi:hypothetical protein
MPRLLLPTAILLCGHVALAQSPPLVSMTRPQEVLATHFTKFGHASSFVELEGGRILHAAGTTFTTSDDGGLTWSKGTQFKDVKGNPVGGGGASLVRLAGRGVGLAAMKQDTSLPTLEERQWSGHIVFWRSEDGGQTWQEPVRASPAGLQTHLLQDVALRTASGRIVLPVYAAFGQRIGPDNNEIPAVGRLVKNQWVSTNAHFHDPRFMGAYVVYSDDDGRTWKRNKDGLLYILHDWSTNFDKVNEPSVAEVRPGRLLMIMRSSLNRLYQAWSNDNGVTWTRPAPMSLAATETPGQIRRLPNGHLLIVWNQESDEEVMRGFNRTRVSAAISRNGGSVWEFFQNITSLLPGTRVEPGPVRPARPVQLHFSPGQPAPERDGRHLGDSDVWIRTSYPSVLVTKDRVLVAHTYSRFEEDAAKAQLASAESYNQVLRVLPLKWFYGGKEPAPNPQLKESLEPANP